MFQGIAQNTSFNGYIKDANTGKALQNATVCIFNAKDSILVAFGRTNTQGFYSIHNVRFGKYGINVSFPGSLDYIDTLRINEFTPKIQDPILLISQIISIKEILITKYNNGLKINGDTTEYLADFFKTNPGATVEDLLKKLPGIQINKNGEITAQGQKVKKILVDGEEFFPDDPSIATKYLRADMIDKVQVYDERKDTLLSNSEEDKTRTLNLTLKDDKKKGAFGRAEAGSDFEKYVNGGLFSGYFNKNLKAAGFVKTSNFENAALSWEDRSFSAEATSNQNVQYSGGMMYSSRSSVFNDELDNRGIPSNTSIGLILNNSFGPKFSIRSSYRYANEGVIGTIDKTSSYFLPDTSFSINENTQNRSIQQGHRLNVGFTFKPDSLTKIDFSNSLSIINNNASSLLKSITQAQNLLNDNSRDIKKDIEKKLYMGSLSFNRQLNKKGRAVSAGFSISTNPGLQLKKLLSSSNFYNENGNVESIQKMDQKQEVNTNVFKISLNTSFVNPMSKKLSYTLNYKFNVNTDKNNTATYESSSGNAELVNELSSNFALDQMQHSVGANLNYKLKKISSWIGVSGSNLQLKQRNFITNQNGSKNYFNLLPNAGIQYTWKKQRNLSLNYNAFNQAPVLSYLQPLSNNNDPLNIFEGNDKLSQTINHGMGLSVNVFQTLKGRYLWSYVSFNLPRNAFVQASTIDSNAIRRTKMINANGNYSMNGSVNYSHRLPKLPISFDIGSSFAFSNNINFVNEEKVTTFRNSISGNTGVSFETETIELEINYEISYNKNTSSLSNQNGNTFITHMPNYYIEVTLPKKFEIHTEGEFNIRPKTDVFEQLNVYYLNGGVNKQLGKKNDFELEFVVHDILNQNIGFDRDISTNLVTNETFTQLSRYWLIKFRWNFNTTGGDDD